VPLYFSSVLAMNCKMGAFLGILAGFFILGYAVVECHNMLHGLDGSIEQTQRQVEAVRAKIAAKTTAHAQVEPTAPDVYADRHSDLLNRLIALEHQVMHLTGRESRENEEQDNEIQSISERPEEILQEVLNSPPPPTVADIFSRDAGNSHWGAEFASRILAQYHSEPYFHRFGGKFEGRCKSRSCQFRWIVPYINLDDPDFTLAEMELMAIATRGDTEVNQVHTERQTKEGQTVISVYVTKL
jgi:hypothetical protein